MRPETDGSTAVHFHGTRPDSPGSPVMVTRASAIGVPAGTASSVASEMRHVTWLPWISSTRSGQVTWVSRPSFLRDCTSIVCSNSSETTPGSGAAVAAGASAASSSGVAGSMSSNVR